MSALGHKRTFAVQNGMRNTSCPLCANSGHGRSYSNTSSARASKDCGTVRPSAFAVPRLITNTNFDDSTTGRSPGFYTL